MSAKTARLYRRYENSLHIRYGERTVPEYLSHARCFLSWLSDQGIELTEVRTEDLQTYQNQLLGRKKKDGRLYSLGFQLNRLTAIKSLFRFLYESGHTLHDPASSLEIQRKESRLPRAILTPKEVRRLIESAKEKTPTGLRDRAILETFYATGIRVSELSKLRPGDVDTEDKTVRIVLGKGRKDRNVPLTSAAAEAIERYLELGRPEIGRSNKSSVLFLADKGGKLHRAVLSRIVQHYAKKAGIKKTVTCHTFRHSVATHLLKGRADIRYIQKLLGHRSLETTQRYTRVEISDLRRVIARAHPRG
ncbi:MAG: tyrosine-type recombinase/integrase [Vicinamibacteria bacterium]